MQIAVNFQNDKIAKKVLWLLEHFKDDGVEVTFNSNELKTPNKETQKAIIEARKSKKNTESITFEDLKKEMKQCLN